MAVDLYYESSKYYYGVSNRRSSDVAEPAKTISGRNGIA